MGGGGGDVAVLYPLQGAGRGVDFHRQGDQREEGGEAEEADADEEQRGEGLDEEQATQEDPGDPLAGEGDDGDKCRAHAQGGVADGMLDGVAALVGGNGGSSHRGAVVDLRAEVEGAVGGVVVVGEGTLNHVDLHIADVVVAQHHLGHLAAREAAFGADRGIFLKLFLHIAARQHRDEGQCDEEHPHKGRARHIEIICL